MFQEVKCTLRFTSKQIFFRIADSKVLLTYEIWKAKEKTKRRGGGNKENELVNLKREILMLAWNCFDIM